MPLETCKTVSSLFQTLHLEHYVQYIWAIRLQIKSYKIKTGLASTTTEVMR